MKKLLIPILLVTFCVSITSCEGGAEPDITLFDNLSTTLTEKSWVVNYSLNNNINETNNFSSYQLKFKEDGVLEAAKPYDLVVGRWVEDKVSKFIILNFDVANTTFSKLNDNWKLVKLADSTVQLTNLTNDKLLTIARP